MKRALLLLAALAVACGGAKSERPILRVSASALGKEGEVLVAQLDRFQKLHPEVEIQRHPTPDAADLRHQLYVQWLNAGATHPDVLQLDVIWTPEFAAAGWILPLDVYAPDTGAFFPSTIQANTYGGKLWALPWFADVGILYYRKDLIPRAPETLDELRAEAERVKREHGVAAGVLFQGARYEGLVCTFNELVGAQGGAILDADGTVHVDDARAIAALTWLRGIVDDGVTPPEVLAQHEEETRLAFQNGRAAFLRNWPYAYALLDDPAKSAVAGKVGVAPMPRAEGGHHTATLGGGQLAVNARSPHPELSVELVKYLTAPEQMLERARAVGQYPTRPALYDDPALEASLRLPGATVRRIVEAATPRPVTPVYTEVSEILQVELHRALTGQVAPDAALRAAAGGIRTLLARTTGRAPTGTSPALLFGVLLVGLGVAIALIVAARKNRRAAAVHLAGAEASEARLAWAFVTPALACIALIAIFPLAWTIWESLHHHDLRLPWTGRPFVGGANYAEALGDARFWSALGHTAIFTVGAVSVELVLGLLLALALNQAYRGRGLVRAAVLIPWAIPTVVAALVWSFMFQPLGITNQLLGAVGVVEPGHPWFNTAASAWVPVILADVWKTTPFVGLLLLAGLQGIDDSLYEAAGVDGASTWQKLWSVTLPLLKPTIAVAVLFRVLDAFRVFDLIYVLTGGGPGTATEPLASYTFNALLQNLRFGYGSALSVLIFVGAFGLAILFIRFLGADLLGKKR